MPLSAALLTCKMTFECPECGFAFVKHGSWFQSVSWYECEGCRRRIRITYPDKLKLFARYQQAPDPTTQRPGLRHRMDVATTR
ncbi:hypothetical protein FJ930_04330 [Mesorhizobium sp. B2-4-15]|nr:hypothetical protein FJ930_04330 [Mesorhizobium sp. B2-4-15]TPM33147.1 hypothetical protein FJ958_10435 [Mesorhizobium sp. B2-3-5]